MKFRSLSLLLMLFAAVSFVACKSDKNAEEVPAENTEVQEKQPQAKKDGNLQKVNAKNNKPAENVPSGPTTTIAFDETTFDFGNITDGEKVRHTYKFTNSGSEPLIISNCKGSCGCTVPQCPKEPIAPGEKGEIVIEYNSRGKGNVEGKSDQKFVTVTANTNPTTTRLTIKGVVKKEESK